MVFLAGACVAHSRHCLRFHEIAPSVLCAAISPRDFFTEDAIAATCDLAASIPAAFNAANSWQRRLRALTTGSFACPAEHFSRLSREISIAHLKYQKHRLNHLKNTGQIASKY